MTLKELQRLVDQQKQQQALLTDKHSEYFRRFKNTQFWPWYLDVDSHKKLYKEGKCGCFNCVISWPRKNDVEMPLFDYQQLLLNTLEHDSKYILVRKSTGLGFTTLFLRWMAWLCLRNDDMQAKEMAVVVGPNLSLAIGLIDKVKSLFLPHGITFDSKATSVTLNQCQINAYPSNHLDAMRSRMDLKVILVDELEFFEPGERAILRDVVERYVSKSDPYILMISTPGAPDGLMQQMEAEESSMYRRFVMDYTVGQDKIYSRAEIARARQSVSFAREMECRYQGFEGNIFSTESIQRAVDLGKLYDPVKEGYIPEARHVIGIDPAYSSSKFAITVLQASNEKVQVLYCEDFDHPDFKVMLHHTVGLMKRYHKVNAVFVDGANVPFIASLKRMLGERPDYEDHIKELKARNPHTNIHRLIRVIPVPFSTQHKSMLSNVKSFMDDDRGLVQIHPTFSKLIDSLKSATAKEYSLLKEEMINDDLFDSFRMAMSYLVYQAQGSNK